VWRLATRKTQNALIIMLGFDQPLVLVTISTVLGGVIMVVYSCLLVVTNRRYLPRELMLGGYRLAMVFAILLLGTTSSIVAFDQIGNLL
jgi:predicted lysophospholipase L1 biosynthesis ABC-type transport system permease subunit